MATEGKATTVFVCRECKHHARLARVLEDEGHAVRAVGCQKVCAEPVCGLEVDGGGGTGGMAWFGGMDRGKRVRALLAHLGEREAALPPPLVKARSKKRTALR